MKRVLTAVFRVITRLEELCLAWGMIAIALLTIANVVGRVFGQSLAFAEELNRFLIVFVTFLGLGYAASKARHIRMTALYDQLPTRVRKALALTISLTTAGLLFGLTWLSVDYAVGTVRVLGSRSPVLGAPLWLVYLSAPLGFFLAGVQYLLAFARNVVDEDVWVSFDHRDGYDEPPAAGI